MLTMISVVVVRKNEKYANIPELLALMTGGQKTEAEPALHNAGNYRRVLKRNRPGIKKPPAKRREGEGWERQEKSGRYSGVRVKGRLFSLAIANEK